jgi:hypothetical protein
VCGRAVKELLPPAYTVKERGKVTVKGKGEMLTYWVESKANRIPPTLAEVRVVLDLLNNILVFISTVYWQRPTLFCCLLCWLHPLALSACIGKL